MVIRIGLVQFIFTVHLCKFGSPKFIENESFVRLHRSNVSDTKDKILNGSLSGVIELASHTPDATNKVVKLQRDARMNRKLDKFGSDRFFYVQTRNAVDDDNTTDRYYINYQKAYGIRYDPRKIKRSFSFKDPEDDEPTTVEPFEDSTTELYEFLDTNESAYDTEDAFFSTSFHNETNPSANFSDTSSLVDGSNNEYPSDANPNPIVAQPSQIQTALQHFNTKIKNLFTVKGNTNPNTQRFLNVFNIIKFENVPCVSAKPPLTQLNGTCYHKFECDELGGIATDMCGGGFGVCCVCKLCGFAFAESCHSDSIIFSSIRMWRYD